MAWRFPFIICILLIYTCATKAQQVIPLYPGPVPNSIPAAKAPTPTLTVYLPAAGKATGTAVVICPGGGYSSVVMKKEGYAVAEAFAAQGVASFVLQYRLPNDSTMQDKTIGPLQDAQQAIRLVRERAKEWQVDPKKIGIIGFSAGGHLASTAGTHLNTVVGSNNSSTSSRPDFMILVYPVISFQDDITHTGSRYNLLGPSPTAAQIAAFSNELQVTPQTPPTFLVHAADDDKVVVQNSIRFYKALQQHKVPAELHLYPSGGHGFGLRTPTDNWLERCWNWMKSNGWLR